MKTRARIKLGICAVLLTAASLLAPGVPPAEAVNRPCCLDEWQGGGICPAGTRVASYCDSGCNNCGTFFCYSGICFQ